MRKLLLLAGLCAAGASAQSISIGAIGGVPFTDAVGNSSFSTSYKSPNLVIGPSFQVSLPASFRIEADALYRPVHFAFFHSTNPTDVSATQWQFPFLLQYRFKTPVLKPFVEAGVSFDHLSNISDAVKAIPSGSGTLLQQSHASVVLGAGVDVKIPFVRISGELRYSHQGSADFEALSKLNQAEVLIGIHF